MFGLVMVPFTSCSVGGNWHGSSQRSFFYKRTELPEFHRKVWDGLECPKVYLLPLEGLRVIWAGMH